MSTAFILIVEMNIQSIQIKKTSYQYVTWIFYSRIIQLKHRHLVFLKKLKALINSEISGKNLKVSLLMASTYAKLIGYKAIVS